MLPFNLKRLKALLREREVGTLTVKKRGSAVEPEELRRRVRLAGAERGDGVADPGGRGADHADGASGVVRVARVEPQFIVLTAVPQQGA